MTTSGGASQEDTTSVPTYCDHCGGRLDATEHATCRKMREMEPPRYCPHCRRRMVVQIDPRAWSARCVEHGEMG